MKQLARLIVFIAMVTTISLISCNKKPFDPALEGGLDTDRYKMQVAGLTAVYNAATGKIDLRWDPLDPNTISYYKVYRTTKKDSTLLAPDSVSLYASEKRDSISKDSTTFSDIPEIANTVYYYGVRGVRTSTNGEKVEGLLTLDSLVQCTVGVEVSFNINRGAIFTATDKCSLIVNDPARIVRSVRFTQQELKYLYKSLTGEVLYIDLDDPTNQLTNAMLPILFSPKNSSARRWIQTKGGVAGTFEENVSYIRVPNFEAVDTLNRIRAYSVFERDNAFYWVLKQGNGEKKVYAEITYEDGRIDTVEDNISIQPFRILIKIRNDMRVGGSMRAVGTKFNIFKPKVEFSISTFSDTTIDSDFSYWFVTSDSAAIMFSQKIEAEEFKISSKREAWLQTRPVYSSLTGIGPSHDDNHIYTYSLDTTTADGIQNLSALQVDTALPPVVGKYVFNLIGAEKFNETAVPGSFWGSDPVQFKSDSFFSSTSYIAPSTNAGQNFRRVAQLTRSKLFETGTKEFSIVFLFKGRFFNDTRTVLLHREVDGALTSRVNFDFYPPKAALQNLNNPDWIGNDSTIVAPFSYALGVESSIQDGGNANISEVKLVIAQYGDNPWGTYDIADNMTLDQLYSYRHIVLPFDLKVSKSLASGVRWDNIDPSDWPSGNYLMGIVTKDEFGNEGLAPISRINKETISLGDRSNPWRVKVLSGK